MKEYIRTQSKMNEAVVNDVFTKDELQRISRSDFRWVDNKKRDYQIRKIKKGEVYQIEFGKNYVPEMSYEHRGLVIGVKKKLLYVLPIFSFDPQKHIDVYHPIYYPNSKSDLYLLRQEEFVCIKHDSVLKLNDIRTVSVNRILYQHPGNIMSIAFLLNKEKLVLKKYFAEFYFEYEQDKKKIEMLENEIYQLKMME